MICTRKEVAGKGDGWPVNQPSMIFVCFVFYLVPPGQLRIWVHISIDQRFHVKLRSHLPTIQANTTIWKQYFLLTDILTSTVISCFFGRKIVATFTHRDKAYVLNYFYFILPTDWFAVHTISSRGSNRTAEIPAWSRPPLKTLLISWYSSIMTFPPWSSSIFQINYISCCLSCMISEFVAAADNHKNPRYIFPPPKKERDP